MNQCVGKWERGQSMHWSWLIYFLVSKIPNEKIFMIPPKTPASATNSDQHDPARKNSKTTFGGLLQNGVLLHHLLDVGDCSRCLLGQCNAFRLQFCEANQFVRLGQLKLPQFLIRLLQVELQHLDSADAVTKRIWKSEQKTEASSR